MNYLYEFVKYDKNIPRKILLQDKPGWRCNTMPHWHSEMEFVYVIEGMLKLMRNGTVSEIHSGEFYFCNSKVIHSTSAPDSASNYKYLVLLLSYDFLLRFHEECDFDVSQGNAYENIREQLRKLAALTEEDSEQFPLNIDIEKNRILLEIYQTLLSQCISKKVRNAVGVFEENSYAKSIMEYVLQHYDQTLSLSMIAKDIGLSPQYLSKYFKKVTGIGITQYINLIRLDYANEELLSGKVSIVEAALNNGFPNVKTYVRICRNVYGMTPSEFRKAMR